MGWNDEETKKTKKGMNTSSKVLLGIIACIILIIMLLIMLLMNTKDTSFKIYVNGKVLSDFNSYSLLTTLNGTTYVNIEEMSKIVGYEYHKGEYKSSTIEEDKCYVEGKNETTSFYLDNNKIYKLQLNKTNEEYDEFTFENDIEKINNQMYAPLEAILIAFNLVVEEATDSFKIYTLEHLINIYDSNVKGWGYTGIANQSFENQKALLYGCLIVQKEGGLYKIIDFNNTKEIVLDRYKSIKFIEGTKEFLAQDNLGKFGIISIDGVTTIEHNYESITVLDKESGLYLVKQANKYGVVKSGDITKIFPEYDYIGVSDISINNTSNNKKLILDTLIPVRKGGKWGAYDKEGNLILNIEYDGFGFESNNIEINGVKEIVQPILAIEKAEGVIVKKSGKYGLFDLNGKEMVPIAVDGIYEIKGIEDEKYKYYMLYNGEEINVIERLIRVGLIEENVDNNPNEDVENSTGNTIDGNNITNEINGTVENQVVGNNEI